MMFIPHGMSGITVLGLELTPLQAEAANGVIKQYPVVIEMEVVGFGVYITEDFVAQTADPVVQLIKNSKLSGTEAVLKSLTLGSSNTTLKKGNDLKAGITAIANDVDLDNGQVVVAKLVGVNRLFAPGDILEFKQSTDATTAGGAYVPFAVVKFGGFKPISSKVWCEVETVLY